MPLVDDIVGRRVRDLDEIAIEVAHASREDTEMERTKKTLELKSAPPTTFSSGLKSFFGATVDKQLTLKLLGLIGWGITCLITFLVAGHTVGRDGAAVLTLMALVIYGWALQPANVSMEYTSLLFLTFVSASNTLTWNEAWDGISSQGVWLIFCGMAMSAGLTETQVVSRTAALLCSGSPSWNRLLFRLHVVAAALAITVPSQVVRVQLVLPMARKILEYRRVAPCSIASTGIILSLVIPVNHCGVGVLTGAVPNLIAIGALQRCDVEVTWGLWFSRMAPTFGAGSAVANLALVLLATRSAGKDNDDINAQACPSAVEAVELTSGGRLSQKERAVLTIFMGSLAMWATDTIHGVRPVIIALFSVLLMFFPLVGPVRFEVLRTKINVGVLIFVASTITIAPLLKKSPDISDIVRKVARGPVSSIQWEPARHMMLFVLALPLILLVNGATSIGLLTPQLCEGGGFSENGIDAKIGMLALVSSQNIVLFPFQCAPLLIVANLANDILAQRHFVVALVANSLLQALVIMPITLAYWSLLGWST